MKDNSHPVPPRFKADNPTQMPEDFQTNLGNDQNLQIESPPISMETDVDQSLKEELQELREKVIKLEQEKQQAIRSVQQHQILLDIIERIRQSLDLNTIFQSTVTEVRQFLQADRVGVFRFEPYSDYGLGKFVSEDVVPGYPSALEAQISDHCFGEQYAAKYQGGQKQIVPNIYEAGMTACHVEILAKFGVIANLVVPLLFNHKLWGLLCVHQCSAPRQWQGEEIDLIQRLADQLSVAIQHAQVVVKAEETATELQTIFSAFPDLYFPMTFDTTIIDFHVGLQTDDLYLSPEMFLGKKSTEIMPPTVALQIEAGVEELQQTGTLVAFEYSLPLPTGLQYYEGRLIPLGNDQIITIVRNITERKQAEQALQESEARFQKIAASVPGMLYQMRQEPDGRMWFPYSSPGCRELFGLEPHEMEQALDLVYPEDLPGLIEQTQRSGETLESFSYEWRTLLPSGGIKWVHAISRLERQPDGVVIWDGLIIDITDRKLAEIELQQKTEDLEETLAHLKRTQAQLIQTEKMSSLGQLVAGVAHEINNPVNFIHGNVIHGEEYTHQLLEVIHSYQENYPAPPPDLADLIEEIDLEFLMEDLPKLLKSMQVGTKRIREIVASLRNFSRLDEAELKEVNIHEGLENTLMILQNRLKARPNHPGIQVIKQYDQLPLVECYPGQLNQVFMNILVNAIDALEERDQSKNYAEIEAHPSLIYLTTEWLVAESQVKIRIKDNGPGIPEVIQNRIFDPFFTTKAIGKGTGLGMSISYQIITEKHQGMLECHSKLGEGAEFLISIPVQRR